MCSLSIFHLFLSVPITQLHSSITNPVHLHSISTVLLSHVFSSVQKSTKTPSSDSLLESLTSLSDLCSTSLLCKLSFTSKLLPCYEVQDKGLTRVQHRSPLWVAETKSHQTLISGHSRDSFRVDPVLTVYLNSNLSKSLSPTMLWPLATCTTRSQTCTAAASWGLTPWFKTFSTFQSNQWGLEIANIFHGFSACHTLRSTSQVPQQPPLSYLCYLSHWTSSWQWWHLWNHPLYWSFSI